MAFVDASLYELLGKLVFYAIIVLLLLILLTLVQFVVSIGSQRFIFPSFENMLIDAFYPILRGLMDLFKLPSSIIEEFDIGLKNRISEKKFISTPVSERIIVLPQCLRSLKCPAKLSAEEGLVCKGCGSCQIDDFFKKAESLGYRMFVVPGGTFVKRIIINERPKAVIAVACFVDLVEGIKIAERAGIAAQGILLETTGCVETTVNWEKVYDKLYLGLEGKE